MRATERLKHIYRYRLDPVSHFHDVLGIKRETIQWDRLPEYEGHQWDSRVWLPGEEEPRPCPNPIELFIKAWAWGYPKIAVASAVGTQKCVRGETLIPTSNGVVRADSMASESCQEVHTSFDIYGAEGRESAGKAFYEGEQPAWEAKTKQGFQVTGSKRHRVVIMTDEGLQWRHVKDLQVGDQVAVQIGMDMWAEEAPTLPAATMRSRAVRPELPKRVTEELAELMGMLVGDGHMRDEFLVFTSADDTLVERFVSLCKGFGLSPKNYGSESNAEEIKVFNVGFNRVLDKLGLGGELAAEKKVPWSIRKSPWPIVRAFLRGLFDADGWVDKRGHVGFATVSEDLAREVQFLLLNAGLFSSVRPPKTSWTHNGEKKKGSAYRMLLSGNDARLFADKVGFSLKRKQEAIQKEGSWSASTDSIPNTRDLLESWWGEAKKRHSHIGYLSRPEGGARPSDWRQGKSNPRRSSLIGYLKANSETSDCPSYQKLLDVVQLGAVFCEVESVNKTTAELYDLSVPGTNTYNANGFVNHNTFTLSAGSLWYLDTHVPSIVRVYGPKEDSLKDNLWGYLGEVMGGMGAEDSQYDGFRNLHPQILKTNDLDLYMDPESDKRERWAMSAQLAKDTGEDQESSVDVQGGHAEYQTIIIEEAEGVQESVWKALTTTASGKNQVIAVCNPDSESSAFGDFWKKDSVLKIRLSGLDAPNYVTRRQIIPGGFDAIQKQEIEEENGPESPFTLSRTRGIIPQVSGECLFQDSALEAVDHRFRRIPAGVEITEDTDLTDFDWKRPLYKIEHSPSRWRSSLLKLAESGGFQAETQRKGENITMEQYLKEENQGIYDIEGHTHIYEPPKFDMCQRYFFAADTANDRRGGDAHSLTVYDRITDHIVAEIHMRGSREAFVLTILSLAQFYRVPLTRDLEYEDQISDEEPRSWVARRYVECEKEVREDPANIEWEEPQGQYPRINWETNNTGSLALIQPFNNYPQLYSDRDPETRSAKRSRKKGFNTNKSTRPDVISALREWGYRVQADPAMVPSEGHLKEMKTFVKNERKGRYEAQEGKHDDRVMSLGIAVLTSDRVSDPFEAKEPAPRERMNHRIPEGKSEDDTMWNSVGKKNNSPYDDGGTMWDGWI